jgi:competence protein ComEA
MKASRYFNGRMVVSVLLTLAIVVGGLIIWSRWDRGQALEITLSPQRELTGYVQIDGEVNIPGIYPSDGEYSIQDMFRMAGGVTDDADTGSLILWVPSKTENQSPQKVNINKAGEWLLEALPGIGNTKARAIIEYRQQNGIFHDTRELIHVEGIGQTLYEEIKDLVTVSD